MKSIKVYVITTPENKTDKTLVRTKPPSVRWYQETDGYTITTGWVNWKAARAIARKYLEAGGTLLTRLRWASGSTGPLRCSGSPASHSRQLLQREHPHAGGLDSPASATGYPTPAAPLNQHHVRAPQTVLRRSLVSYVFL